MKRGAPHGYTIVEVMIFLAVTGLLFVMIAMTFAGQRGRTQFQASAREMESRARDIINDTSSGYYARTEDFGCDYSDDGPEFSDDASDILEQGASGFCIFIGRVAHFRANNIANRYNVYTVAGLRVNEDTNREVTSFAEAFPRAIVEQSPDGSVDLTQGFVLPSGAEVASVYYNNGAANVQIRAIGFFSSFGKYGPDGKLQSGSQNVNLIPIAAPANSKGSIANAIENLSVNPFVVNPASGITVCINSGTSSQHATLKFGGEGGPLTVDMTIGNGTIAANGTC